MIEIGIFFLYKIKMGSTNSKIEELECAILIAI
jgi:hypothetical protein